MALSLESELLYLEVPIYSNNSPAQRWKEIEINEGPDGAVEAENCSFPDAGGAMKMNDGDENKSLFWRTHDNVLELQERSLNVALQQASVRIKFKNSKLLPYVEMHYKHHVVTVLFGTVHAVRRFTFSVPRRRNDGLSIFHQLTEACFEDAQNVLYFSHNEQLVGLRAAVSCSPGVLPTAMFAVLTSSGNINLIKMPSTGTPVAVLMNQTSRMSRLLSGFNPWAGNPDGEIPCGLTFVGLETPDPKLVAICVDCKIRIWSCKGQECIMQLPLNEYIGEEKIQHGSEHRICSARATSDKRQLVSVYLKFARRSQFINFEVDLERTELRHVSTVAASLDADSAQLALLVDFKIGASGRLWALSIDADELTSLAVCDVRKRVWHEVALTSAPTAQLGTVSYTSVPEAYIDQLFVSGHFSLHAIAKVLAIKQRSSSAAHCPSYKALKSAVIAHLEQEVEAAINDTHDVIEAQLTAYQHFYETCVQYQHFVSRPVGLGLPDTRGLVDVVKKDHISYLVPVSNLEAVCRGANPMLLEEEELREKRETNFSDLSKLLGCLSNLSTLLGDEFISNLLQSISYYETPMVCVEEHMETIRQVISGAKSDEFEDALVGIDDIMSAVRLLIMCLPPDSSPDGCDASTTTSNVVYMHDEGVELLSRSVQRYIRDRLHLSLLLLILTMIVDDDVHDALPAQVSSHVQAYGAVQWAVTAATDRVTRAAIESAAEQTGSGGGGGGTTDAVPHGLLLDYYLKCDGGKLLWSLLPAFDGFLTQAQVPRATVAVARVLWPLGPVFALPPFLLQKAQFTQLEHYLNHQVTTWCDFELAYSAYLLAHCHLHTGHYNKAVEKLVAAAESIHEDPILIEQVLKVDPKHLTRQEVEGLYFSKVLEILERMELCEQVVALAKHAIGKWQPTDHHMLATFYSCVFKHSLYLSRYEEAYWAIVFNPDTSHRKNCLRAMVVCLCERRQFRQLVTFSYDHMHDDFVAILEERARCCDVTDTTPSHYDLLFSFHVLRKNYRRAASMMYQQALRLMEGKRSKPLQSLRRQQQCLVATVSTLLLADPENQWVVHPASPRTQMSTMDGKTDDGGKRVTIKSVDEVRQQLILIEARMKLAKNGKDESLALASSLSAHETVTLLTHAGFYDDAFAVSRHFRLKLQPVFEAVASRCIHAPYTEDNWTWLNKNKLPIDLDHGRLTTADLTWLLLRAYLHSSGTTGADYRATLEILLGYRSHLPAWFTNDYKKVNCPELIRTLICYDYLDEASQLCVQYIAAVMGESPEQFNIKNTLSGHKQVWLPHTEIEHLLLILDEKRVDDVKYDKMHATLVARMEDYMNAVKRKSSAQFI